MLTRTDRRRLPVLFAAIAALAVAGTVLGLLFSEVDAHTADDGPHGPEHTHFYLWRTTMTVGKTGDLLGYHKSEEWGELSTSAKFNYPPWSPPGKHHFDPDYQFEMEALYLSGSNRGLLNVEGDNFGDAPGTNVGKITLWIGNSSFRLANFGKGGVGAWGFIDPDLDWEEDDEIRVALVYERAVPSAPENVSVTAPRDEDGTLEVSWDAAEDGTFPIECYLVEFLHPSGETNRNKQSYPGSRGTGKGCGDSPPTSVKRTDLEAQTRYEVRVQALSGDGYGDWSDTKRAPRTHGIPTSCDLDPSDLWCGVVTVGRGSDYFGYAFEPTPVVGDLSDEDFDVGTNSYTIWAIAAGSSTASTPGALNLTFDNSTRPTTADRDKLVLHVGRADYRLSQASVSVGRVFRWNDAGLDWSRKEFVIVRLREDSSDRSGDSSGQKKQSDEPVSAPDEPTGLDATATHDSVTLTWDDPQDDSITGYVILRRLPGIDPQDHFDVLVADTGTDATTHTDDTVSAETRYTYRIKAINGAGTSERSRWVHINTPAAPEPETPPEPDNNPASGAPTISGTAQVGETLTSDRSEIADEDGLSNADFSYQWLADDADIADATGSTYTLTDSEEGNAIRVRVSFTDDSGNEETLTSAATEAVAAAEPTEPPAKPRGLEATATHDSITLTWNDPDDDSITGYVILRRLPGVDPKGQFDELVADTGTAATTYTDDTVAAETRYTYRIKAINGAGTSKRSRWYHIDTPAAPASKPAVADGPPGLVPNAPNPFNASTLIPYRLDADGPVRLEIYNLLGQSMRTLVDQYQDAGFYKVRWDARDRRGALVSAGMYLVRLHYPGGVQTQRLLYLK